MCLALAALMLLALVASCKKKEDDNTTSRYDPENDVVRFAIEGQDGVSILFSRPRPMTAKSPA